MTPVPLTADLVESFAGVLLSPMYDNPQPTPRMHRECWELYCSDAEMVAIAAPREHAKSTALTHDFVLAAVLFRWESHVMIVSSTEEMAMGQLGDIATALREDDDLRKEFGVITLESDSKGEIIVLCDDGYRFRILARGVEQRVRGTKWNGRRPGLIICDDIEEDEQVASKERRKKLKRWVNRAMIPMGRRGVKIRWHGTILHKDSMLAGLMKNPEWTTRLYRAHASFDDFSDILWPEQFPEKRLRAIRRRFTSDGDAAGYAQEYLNDPRDHEDAYLKEDWFRAMREDDHDTDKLFGVGVDFAISKADRANRTALVVGGKDAANFLNVVDVRVGRMDSEEIIDEIISVQRRWHPDFFWVEGGQIWLALKATLLKELLLQGIFINFVVRTPIKDKASRGRALQKRMKCGGMKFDKDADWYEPFKEELLDFSEEAEADLDDQFDGAALLALGFEELPEMDEDDFTSDEEWTMRRQNPRLSQGRSTVTGY